MKNLTQLLTIYFLSISFSAFSQTENMNNWCGTTFTKEMLNEVQISTEKYMKGDLIRSKSEYSIPITIHNIRTSYGTEGLNMLSLLDVMCEVIDFYASLGINLYIDDVRNIDNTFYTDNLSIDSSNNIDNTVNIYAFRRTPEPQIPGQGFCGYYSPSRDVIVIATQYCFTPSTVIHEIGHFFSLPHTFSGFPLGQHNCGVYVTSGEKVDGSNCATAADRICDTPPDNNSLGSQGCPQGMTCVQYDPDGVAFMPDPTNYMSYFKSSCNNKLTDGQVGVMIDNIENKRADFIHTDINMNPVVETVELNSPVGAEIPYDQVIFEWNTAPNANLYYIEINRTNSFSSSLRVDFAFTKETQYISNKLEENQTYHWRVLPVNGANTCSINDIWTSGSFKTNDQTVLPKHIETFDVSPNPVNKQPVTISLTSKRFMNGQLYLYDVAGRRIHSKNIQVVEGSNTFNLDVQGLAAGLYLVYLEFSKDTVWQKLIIQ